VKFFSGGQFGTEMIAWMTRDEKRFSLEEMHHKLSRFPAEVMGLADRGALLPGFAADIIVYDLDAIGYQQGRYDKVYDLPGGDWRRVARAEGFRHIVVNGQVTFSDNECSGATPGRLLAPGDADRNAALANL
jgi:N-acyl-D-aspartate/D-glutamate deacylase